MISHWMKCAVLGTALALGTPVVMAQGSAALAPTTQLAGQTLQLNGQGVRYRTVIPVEYVPGKGTVFLINGVQKGETVTEPGFMEAVLRIWVGPKPVDSQLKELLLGAPPKKTEQLHQG